MGAERGWAALVRRARGGAHGELTDDERTWYSVGSLLEALESDGLVSYYRGPGADHLSDCVSGLKQLKTGPIVTLMSMVGKLFPFGVPTDSESRSKMIDTWRDDPSMTRVLDLIDDQAADEAPFIRDRLDTFVRERGLRS